MPDGMLYIIALDKCPGVCLIGIGKVSSIIFVKVMDLAAGKDIRSCVGCSGLRAGIYEGAV